ncbi:MAG: hypothetical protein GF372_04000, partial [Candidatus Marinimicrobia bacterium]|nr:hypothetical protein [Candidatus Neomarinimicrobiota bacterium]
VLYEIFWSAREGHAVEVLNDRIYLFGGYRFDDITFSDIFYSDVWSWAEGDGINWTEEVDTASWAPRRDMATVVYDNQIWIIGGLTNNSSRENFGAVSDVWSTTNGANWDRIADSTQTDFPGMSGHAAVNFNGKMYITGGSNSSTEEIYGRVYSSTDGINWTLETDSPGWVRANHASVVFDGKIWVIGGEGAGFDNTNDVWSSTDGQTWTQVTASAPWAAREDHTCVVFGDRIWLMGGTSVNGRENDIWYSEDGESWTQVDPITEIWPARSGHGTIVYENNVWILGGSAAFDTYLRDIWKTFLPQ